MGNQTFCSTDRQINPQMVVQTTRPQDKILRHSSFQAFINTGAPERFGYLIVKNKNANNILEFVLQSNQAHEEIIDYSEKFYPTMEALQIERPWQLNIEFTIKDASNVGTYVHVGTLNGMKRSFLVRSFSRFEEASFKPIIYNHHINRLISITNYKHLHNAVDSFFLGSGDQRLEGGRVSVIVKEQVSASLEEINFFRRLQNWKWTQMQFEMLLYHSLCGLDSLHSRFMSHNDIRPFNIYYSLSKHSYVLGGFDLTYKHLPTELLTNVALGASYYLSPEAKRCLSQKAQYNHYKNDVYALGMTLLTTFFLNQPSNPDYLIATAVAHQKSYSKILKVLLAMVAHQSQRPNTKQLLGILQAGSINTNRNFNRQDTLIASLRYKQTQTGEELESDKRIIADTYQSLYLNNRVQEANTELLHYYQVKGNKLQQANTYFKLAQTNPTSMEAKQYFHESTRLYSEIGEAYLKEHRFDQSIFYYNKAFNAVKYERPEDYSVAILLKQLSEAHSAKGQYDISKSFLQQALYLTQKSKGPHSLQYANMLVEIAKVQSEFQQYKTADQYLKSAIKVIEYKDNQNIPQANITKARILQTLGNNLRLKAKTHPNTQKRGQYRTKSQQCLQEAISINESLPDNDFKLASNHQNLGHVYFQQKQFQRARQSYQRSYVLRKNRSNSSIQLGENLTYIANCNKTLREYDKAIRNYNDALAIFRKEIGNDHNPYTAVALGNLGLVYKEVGNEREASEYIKVAKRILKDLQGEDSPDYMYFSKYA